MCMLLIDKAFSENEIKTYIHFFKSAQGKKLLSFIKDGIDIKTSKYHSIAKNITKQFAATGIKILTHTKSIQRTEYRR